MRRKAQPESGRARIALVGIDGERLSQDLRSRKRELIDRAKLCGPRTEGSAQQIAHGGFAPVRRLSIVRTSAILPSPNRICTMSDNRDNR